MNYNFDQIKIFAASLFVAVASLSGNYAHAMSKRAIPPLYATSIIPVEKVLNTADFVPMFVEPVLLASNDIGAPAMPLFPFGMSTTTTETPFVDPTVVPSVVQAQPVNPPKVTPPESIWKITGNQVVSLDDLDGSLPTTSDGNTMAAAIINIYRAKGFITVQARVDQANHLIQVVEPKSKLSGKYADYVPDVSNRLLSQEDLKTAIARAKQAATANGEKLTIKVEQLSEDNTVDVTLDGTPTLEKSWGGSVVASTLGPLYASSDVVTISGYQHLGNGITLDGGYSYGLSDLRADSRGGNYSGINAGLSMGTSYGNFGARVSDVNFKVGGVNLPLNQTGKVFTVEGNYTYIINDHARVGGKLVHTEQTTRIGLVDFEDKITTDAVQVNGSYNIIREDYVISLDAYAEHGLKASHDTQAPVPLYDEVDPHYTTVGANVAGLYKLGQGWNIEARAGGQHGSEGTPPNSQFYVGGPDRGSSYQTGVLSGPSGIYGSMTLVAPNVGIYLDYPWIKSINPFIGVDGGRVIWTDGRTAHVQSASAGFRFDFGAYGSGQLGISTPISDKTGRGEPQIMFVWSMPF